MPNPKLVIGEGDPVTFSKVIGKDKTKEKTKSMVFPDSKTRKGKIQKDSDKSVTLHKCLTSFDSCVEDVPTNDALKKETVGTHYHEINCTHMHN